jgi:hypothetical protein
MDAIGSTTQSKIHIVIHLCNKYLMWIGSTPARSGSSSPSRRASGTFSPLASPIMQHSSILLDQHQQHSLFMPDDIQQFLRSNPLFHNRASDEFLRELAGNMHIRHHQTGDIIVKEGEIGRAMFFIVRGLAVVGSQDSDSIFAELSPGNLFGGI